MLKIIFMLCGLLIFGATAYAADDSADTNLTNLTKNPLYFGVMTGYGNTDWSQLVAQDKERERINFLFFGSGVSHAAIGTAL